MESSELELYRGLGAVRNYGIFVLVALFGLNGSALMAINWYETNDIQNELMSYSQTLPEHSTIKKEQTINLPDEILSFPGKTGEIGFYEKKLADHEYLAYANKDKDFVLMKSEESIKHELRIVAMVLSAVYLGEVAVLFGWWLFVRSKVRELFEVV